MSAPDIILKLSNIESYYGPIQAIRGISLEVPRGQIVTLFTAAGRLGCGLPLGSAAGRKPGPWAIPLPHTVMRFPESRIQ